jgi:hypothetical protein
LAERSQKSQQFQRLQFDHATLPVKRNFIARDRLPLDPIISNKVDAEPDSIVKMGALEHPPGRSAGYAEVV